MVVETAGSCCCCDKLRGVCAFPESGMVGSCIPGYNSLKRLVGLGTPPREERGVAWGGREREEASRGEEEMVERAEAVMSGEELEAMEEEDGEEIEEEEAGRAVNQI